MKNANEYKMTQAVYVHIPFCRQKCLYCDFASYAGCSQQQMDAYADAVCLEIAGRAAEAERVANDATIYFGGGTPSTLPMDALAKIVLTLKRYGFWRSPAEATIEVNPGTADLEKLRFFRSLGFDRISFGVQSLNDAELKTIGRIHSAAEALDAIQLAKAAGFERISADLIYGLPGQLLESLKATIESLLATGIEHMSVYGLIVEEGTPLAKLVDSGRLQLPDEDTAADMYDLVQQMLKSAGFKRYEISNYAKNEQYSRHNLVYWQYHPYVAFGAAAAGFDGRVRRSSVEMVAPYMKGVQQLYGAPNVAFGAAAAGFDGRVRRSSVEMVAPYIKGVQQLYGAPIESRALFEKRTNTEQCLEKTAKGMADVVPGIEKASKEAENAMQGPANAEKKHGLDSVEREKAYAKLYIEEKLTRDELFGEFMFMGLRRAQGADLKEAKERFSIDVWERYHKELQPLIEHELLVYDKENGYLRLTEQGMAVGNQIFEIFV